MDHPGILCRPRGDATAVGDADAPSALEFQYRARFIPEFLLDARDALDEVHEGIPKLRQDPSDRDVMAEVSRAFHTLKGTAGLLGFVELARLALASEALLRRILDGELAPGLGIADALAEVAEVTAGFLERIAGGQPEGRGAADVLIQCLDGWGRAEEGGANAGDRG